jgi:hypothetical protein
MKPSLGSWKPAEEHNEALGTHTISRVHKILDGNTKGGRDWTALHNQKIREGEEQWRSSPDER